jgi:hypothetical protein
LSKRESCSQRADWSMWAVVLAAFVLTMNAKPVTAQDIAIDSDDISPLINSRDRFRHTAYRCLCRKVAQYAVPPMLGLDFINGLLSVQGFDRPEPSGPDSVHPEGRGPDRLQGDQPHDQPRHAALPKGRLSTRTEGEVCPQRDLCIKALRSQSRLRNGYGGLTPNLAAVSSGPQ